MNDKIRAWVDARICQRCWKSRMPFTNRHGQPEIDCTCGGAAARQAELDRRHQRSVEAAADTVELHSWRGRMRGKGWLSS